MKHNMGWWDENGAVAITVTIIAVVAAVLVAAVLKGVI